MKVIILKIIRATLLMLNWVILGSFGLILIGSSVNSNSRLFIFGIGSIALGFIFHLIIYFIFPNKYEI